MNAPRADGAILREVLAVATRLAQGLSEPAFAERHPQQATARWR